MKNILLINLKTYEEGTGAKALEIAKIANRFAGGKTEIIIAAQATDIRLIASEVNIPVFSQHVDPVKYGSGTGWTLPESVKHAGAKGTLLNHSERRIDTETLRKSLSRCRELALRTVVCAETPDKAKEIASLKPDYIAIEPPELIGGDISVSKTRPEVITDSIRKVNSVARIPVLCGAGIKNSGDVRKALELGAKGILVASGVVRADVKEAISDLLKGFE